MIFQSSEIQKAATFLKRGEVVAFPTETVYGLGASVFLPETVQKIFQIKGRPQDNPLIVHIAHLKQLPLIAKEWGEEFDRLAHAFFPGPLTVLLPKGEAVPSIVSANLPTIGVRMPAHPIARELIEAVGPLVAPSANLSGRPSSTTAQHVLDDFGETICGVLDGGPCHYGIESTVVTLTPTPLILRPGAISQQQIEEVLQRPLPFAEGGVGKPLSPGMRYRHYAPDAKVTIFHSSHDLESYLQRAPKLRRMVVTSLQPSHLFALLRQADAEQQEEIVILCDASMQQNRALMDRLNRAAIK
jgi:L-threonylcarbamoyladenylate synthase